MQIKLPTTCKKKEQQ